MSWLYEKLFPELTFVEPGPGRKRLIEHAMSWPRIHVAALTLVMIATGLFVLWDKLIESVSSNWSLFVVYGFYPLALAVAVWSTRRGIRRRLRVQLVASGIPICIPRGYNLTGNVTGVCPECGTEIPSASASAQEDG